VNFFISLLLKIHWHICEAHFQLMFDKEYLPVPLFFVEQKGVSGGVKGPIIRRFKNSMQNE